MNTALTLKKQELPNHKEIVLSMRDTFPVTVKIKDDVGKVVGTYLLVKTKNNGFMLQK